MSTPAQPPEMPDDLNRLLNAYKEGLVVPSYWEGHEFGDGDAIPQIGLTGDSASRYQAVGGLMRYVKAGGEEPPPQMGLGEVYEPGSQFSAAQYPPGTLFRAYRETLLIPTSRLPLTPSSEQQAQLTPRPSEEDVAVTSADGWTYTNQALWLMTGEVKRGGRRPVLYAMHAGALVMGEEGKAVFANPDLWREPNTITVGEVTHTIGIAPDQTEAETLHRFLRIYRCNEAEPPYSPFITLIAKGIYAARSLRQRLSRKTGPQQ